MQSLLPETVEAQNSSPWMHLWWKNWSYTSWLLTSTITSIITSEIYTLILSVYPDFFTNLFFSIGINSVPIATALTWGSILAIGLVSGWIIYSAQLFLHALRTAHREYQPLIDLWTNYNQNYTLVFNHLLKDESFVKLSQFLKNQTLPEHIHQFLKNEKNIASIDKILTLLKKIWSIEQIDEKIKTLTLNILSDCSNDEATAHVDNIFALFNLIHEVNQFDNMSLLKALENSERLKPYLPQLQSLSTHKDILYKLIEEPNLMPFYLALQELFSSNPALVSTSIDSIYLYLRYNLSDSHSYHQFKIDQPFIGKNILIKPATFRWLTENFFEKPKSFVHIFLLLNEHPLVDWVEPLFEFMSMHDKYKDFLSSKEACICLANAFRRNDLIQDPNYSKIFEQITQLNTTSLKTKLCDIMLVCLNENCLNTEILETIISTNKIEAIYQVILEAKSHPSLTFSQQMQEWLKLSSSVESLASSVIEQGPNIEESHHPKKKRHNPLHWFAKRIHGSKKHPNDVISEQEHLGQNSM